MWFIVGGTGGALADHAIRSHLPESAERDAPESTPETADAGEATTTEAPAIVRDELYDLDADPGERHNVARQHPDVMADMRARLTAAMIGVPVADAVPPVPATRPPAIHLRFSGAGRVHRVAGRLTVGAVAHGGSLRVQPAGVPVEAFRLEGGRLDFAFVTAPDALVGFDVLVEPPGAPIAWQFFLDDGPWPARATFTGPFGLPAIAARVGIESDDARAEVYAAGFPLVDLSRDLGVFVTRDKPDMSAATSNADPEDPRSGQGSAERSKEMQRVLEEWGYAHTTNEASRAR